MKMRKILAITITFCLLFGIIPAGSALAYDEAHTIVLSSAGTSGGYSHSASLDGVAVEEYDYTWHADPGEAHGEVKNAPAEYYTGTKPDTDAAAYIAHDIFYYPELPAESFKRVQYDGEQEWVYYYTAEGYTDYIFATLPASGNTVPESMMHSEEEAYKNAVLHITQAGTYILKGEWHGQIWIDLGDPDDTFVDESAKVTVILDGVDVTCTVAPALVFYSVYECDNTWEDQSSWSYNVDTADAGANVIIADGTVNNFTGGNIYRMLKTTYKDGQEGKSVPVQKKMRKLDGAFYSYVSMNIDGETAGTGVLNITAGYEGLDTELHLTVNGGNVNIFSQDDGINVNEDGVSVVTFNGGSTHILAGLGSEGDGIDSNGFLVVNGGTVIALAKPNSDSGMDSDSGTYINGGTVVALGSTMDYARSDNSTDAGQAVMNLQFTSSQSADEAIIVTDTSGKVVFAYDPDKDEVAGANARWYRGAIVSAPGLRVGEDYYVFVGGDVTGTETEGVYDVATVTGFSSEAKQQSYSSTGNLGGRGGGMGGGDRRGGGRTNGFSPDGNIPGMPGGQQPQGGFDGMAPPNMPNGQQPQGGFDGSTPPDMPGGQQPQDGFGNQGQIGNASSDANTITFTMTYKVNSFSGVADYNGGTTAPGNASQPQLPGTASGNFTDVNSGAYYADAVAWAVAQGVTNGTGDGTTFSPADTVTRAEAMTFLWRAAGSPAPQNTSDRFTDVPTNEYYSDAVAWAVENGITEGTGDGTTFSPDAPVTNAQMLAFLARAMGAETTGSDWQQAAMDWAGENGLTEGLPGTIDAAADCPRSDVVFFLWRIYGDK